MLREGANLLQVYEMLASLEGTSMKAQQALESGTNVNLQEATNLNSYFQKVLAGGLVVLVLQEGPNMPLCSRCTPTCSPCPRLTARTSCLPAASSCRSK